MFDCIGGTVRGKEKGKRASASSSDRFLYWRFHSMLSHLKKTKKPECPTQQMDKNRTVHYAHVGFAWGV